MYETLKTANAKRWTAMKLTKDFSSLAHKLVASKTRYVSVQTKTGVPWPIIAVIHERESSQDFNTQLAQGDPLGKVSVHVPRGQGPYFGIDAWERAAYIALQDTGAIAWKDWSIGGALTFLEKYNGMGYYSRKQPSPYIWAGTNQYKSGKFVSDGVYSATAVDTQPGCANLLLAMSKIDTSIQPLKLSSPTPIKPAGPVIAGGAIATAGAAAVNYPHHWPWIIGGTMIALLIAWAVYHTMKDTP